MATFRMVHFVPDPFLGGRVPIAAMVKHGNRAEVVPLCHLPGHVCTCDRARTLAVQLMLESIMRAPSLDALPVGVGPQCVLGESLDVPAGFEDARAWLLRLLAGAVVPPVPSVRLQDHVDDLGRPTP